MNESNLPGRWNVQDAGCNTRFRSDPSNATLMLILISLILLVVTAWNGEAKATELNLSWQDNADNEEGFKIERATGTNGTFAHIATVGPDITNYSDSPLAKGTTYCYRVYAFNAASESDNSNVSCGTTLDEIHTLVASNGNSGSSLLVGSVETSGLARGPSFQLFDAGGNLLVKRFALTPNFSTDLSFLLGNLDADPDDEILVGGWETGGLSRGPGFEIYDPDGTLIANRFVMNPDVTQVKFSIVDVKEHGVLVCGLETKGTSRGPIFQVFDGDANLLVDRFVLNTDFTVDYQCLGADLDGVRGDEILVGGREVGGLARGPAFQVWDEDGNLRLGNFVLNPDFTKVKFAVADEVTSTVIASGKETTGLARGPAFQLWDRDGNLLLTRFPLNTDFNEVQVFGANTTNGAVGNEIVVGGTETGGLSRGPAFEIWDQDGNFLVERLVLNPDFTEVQFTKIDINNDGEEEILVVGRETGGLARGSAIQIWDSNENVLFDKFVLNEDFTKVDVIVVDEDGDGDHEIGVSGVETGGLARGFVYQVWESDGSMILSRFILNQDLQE